MTTMANQLLISESIWHSIARITQESECHCRCGETFSSLAHYIGKKTGSISQTGCPSCGSHAMAYVLPPVVADRSIPDLSFQQEEKRKKFRHKLVRFNLSDKE